MKEIISVVLFLGLCLTSVCSAWEHIWTQKADMPTPRKGHTSAVVNGKIYVMGGSPSEGTGSRFAIVEEFDPVTNAWTRKTDMPIARGGMSSSVVDGRIYAIGGGSDDGFSIVAECDPVTDTWTRKADMPTPRRWLATCAVNGRIYAIGGLTSDAVQGTRTVEEYDPATDTWARKADMPMGLWALCANVVNEKIYVLGGRPDYIAIPNVYAYDPATDIWTRKTDMPVGTSQMTSVVLGDKIVVMGGWLHSNNPPYTTLQIYDPEEDTWTIEADVPFLRAVFSADVVNDRIYVIGGTDRPHPCPALSTVFELTINPPSPDFNGDGMIDSADMCFMVDYWGTNCFLCDIAPPLGDGVVNVEDLKVLAEHLFEEVNDPTLVAHWAFDEAEGTNAGDSVGENNAYVMGAAVWRPNGGQVGGALQLNGANDYLATEYVVNPADGAFSVLAWIKGGMSGQVIVTQKTVSDWLLIDAEGRLMTSIQCEGRSAGPLLSEAVIADGQWRRVGLVWDGSYRTLTVDGVAVAEDILTGLVSSDQGLYIGAGSNLEQGTFFSGLIDDVRIYNRAVKP